MSRVRTQISFKGFTEAEVREGLPHLKKMFRERPWLLKARAVWDKRRNCLVVAVEAVGANPAVLRDPAINEWEKEDRDGGANWDEINECVDACFHQSADEVIVTVDSSVRV